ncbi:MAG: CHRD domain-containing protein [Candidatus Binatia bacterium]
MKSRKITGLIGVAVFTTVLSTPILANAKTEHKQDDGDRGRNARVVKAELIGYQEVPSVSSSCEGDFRAKISNDDSQIDFELSYAGLEGEVQQAHIHFGQKGVNGGVSIFLCSNLGNGPAGTPLCPGLYSGTVTGTRVATDVVGGAAAQGLAAGEIEELVDAIHAGTAYINVHSTAFPTGECRGQVK